MILSATAFLLGTSAKNRAIRQLRRLKQPKYLLASLAGLSYFWWLFARQWFTGRHGRGPSPELASGLVEPIAMLAFFSVAITWLFGASRQLLAFGEAEVQFLFPAPVSRRELLLFRVTKLLARTGVSSLFASIIGAAALPVRWPLYFLGLWLAFAVLSLHLIGLALLQLELERWGRVGAALRSLVGAALLAASGYAILSTRPPVALGELGMPMVSEWAQAALSAPPLAWVLWPFAAVLRPALSPTPLGFLSALPWALAIFVGHLAFVLTRSAPFEEVAATESAELASRLRTRRTGPTPRVGWVPWKLSAGGAPLLALPWRSFVHALRSSWGGAMLRATLLAGVVALALGVAVGEAFGATGPATALVFGVVLVLTGPVGLRLDFRQDVERLDQLKALPLAGWQVALGELLAPAGLLGAAELLLALVAAGTALDRPDRALWLSAAFALATLGPTLSFAALLVHNAIALWFPDWAQGNTPLQERSIEWLGQRLLTLVGSWVLVAVGILPALAVGGAIAFLLRSWLGLAAALVPGTLFAALLLAAECALGTWLLGKSFDRHEPGR